MRRTNTEWFLVDGVRRPVRGFETAVEVLIRIRRKHPHAQICGPFPTRDSAHFAATAKAANP